MDKDFKCPKCNYEEESKDLGTAVTREEQVTIVYKANIFGLTKAHGNILWQLKRGSSGIASMSTGELKDLKALLNSMEELK